MAYTHSEFTVKHLNPGNHCSLFYETEEEHKACLTHFLRRGLQQGEKVIYVIDTHTVDTILGYLRDVGLDVDTYLEKGQFRILKASDVYLRGKAFDPDKMITSLRMRTQLALDDGYDGLRCTSEMTWALKGFPGSARLIEYEAKLNKFLRATKCLALCQYDRRYCSSSLLLHVLATHPLVSIGTKLRENHYYMMLPPFLGSHSATDTLDYVLDDVTGYSFATNQGGSS